MSSKKNLQVPGDELPCYKSVLRGRMWYLGGNFTLMWIVEWQHNQLDSFNLLIPKISLVILLTICHIVLVNLENLVLDQLIIP